ncbi:MAG: hypothetical protein ACYC7D_02500 [Nitrososphaerales archaeon]
MLLPKLKKSIASKMKNVIEGVEATEKSSGLQYPPYYVEPILTLVESRDNVYGLGVLYARTRPVESNGTVRIVVELSAPLLLYGSKSLLKVILAHEMLHYVELVRRFVKMDLVTQITSASIFEEGFEDASRAIDPSKVYKDKKLIALLRKKEKTGFTDEKLNEKCRVKWIEKGLPIAKIPAGRNQASISVESIMRTNFDPKVRDLIANIQ